MSDTPRTAIVEMMQDDLESCYMAMKAHAQRLERDLAAAQAEVERLKANIAVPKESSSLPYRQQLRLAAWPLLVHFILTVIAILVFL